MNQACWQKGQENKGEEEKGKRKRERDQITGTVHLGRKDQFEEDNELKFWVRWSILVLLICDAYFGFYWNKQFGDHELVIILSLKRYLYISIFKWFIILFAHFICLDSFAYYHIEVIQMLCTLLLLLCISAPCNFTPTILCQKSTIQNLSLYRQD